MFFASPGFPLSLDTSTNPSLSKERRTKKVKVKQLKLVDNKSSDRILTYAPYKRLKEEVNPAPNPGCIDYSDSVKRFLYGKSQTLQGVDSPMHRGLGGKYR